MTRKISKSIGIISKASFFLSKSSLYKLYYALVYPYLQYCIVVWGSTYPSNLDRIRLLQKRIIRVINKDLFNAHTDPIFSELKILKFDKIYFYHLGITMYRSHNNLLPRRFVNVFLKVNQVHNYNTRSSKLYYLPYCRTNIRKFSAFYQGPKLFNTLMNVFPITSSFPFFKANLKEYLFTY